MLKYMEDIEDLTTSMTSNVKNNGFISHVFRYDDNTKSELSNLVQYAVLAIIPIVILNKLTQAYVPESDDNKPTFEIVIEILLQVMVLFVGMYFIHRLVTFIPTFSKVRYSDINLLNITLCFMVIVLSLQTKLGLKVEILSDRFLEYVGLVDYEKPEKQTNNKRGNVAVTQPITHNGGGVPIMQHQPSRADTLGNYQQMPNATSSIDQLPNQLQPQATQMQQPQMQQQMPPQQQGQNFDSMYQEPFAANDMLGGGYTAF